jgi:hypothetical protein
MVAGADIQRVAAGKTFDGYRLTAALQQKF